VLTTTSALDQSKRGNLLVSAQMQMREHNVIYSILLIRKTNILMNADQFREGF
jgi:hypothetical protein